MQRWTRTHRCAVLWLLATAGASAIAQSGSTAALNVPWTQLAPQTLTTQATGPAGGRVLSIAADPADATHNTIYIGTTGGLFKSTNAAALNGVSFVPVTDLAPPPMLGNPQAPINLVNVGAVTVQPGNTGVIIAGTGDPTNLPDSLYGTGILRSADGGNTWKVITDTVDPITRMHNSFFGEAFTGFAWSTTQRNLVVAAATTTPGAYKASAGYTGLGSSASGIFYSTDAGQTWQLATIQDGTNKVLQSAIQQKTGVVALAVVWNPVRQIFVAALRNHGFYSSPDGMNWTRLASQPGGTALKPLWCPASSPAGSQNCPIYSAALAVQPATGDMFAMAVSQSDQDSGLWQDVCAASNGTCSTPAPVFGTKLGNAALETSTGVISGSSHALWLQAIPSGTDTLLFAGTQDIFRCSLAAGCVWRNATNVTTCPSASQVGANQHSVAFVPGTTTLFFGNDRGLWRSRDAVNQQQPACSADDATHFDNLNTSLGPLAEITSITADPADPNQVLAGAGLAGTEGGHNGAWQLLQSGQGAYAEAGWGANAGWWFATSGPGVSITGCALGASCGPGDFPAGSLIGNAQTGGDGSALNAPAVWMLDPEDPTRMMVATCRLWRGPANGKNWTSANALSSMLDGQISSTCQSTNTQVSALAASGAISGDPNLAERVYVGLAGAGDGAFARAGHLWTAQITPTSTTTSTTWRDIANSPVTNGLSDPNFNSSSARISSIALDLTDRTGRTVYVGIGAFSGVGMAPLTSPNVPLIYGSTDGGSSWRNLTSNLPNAPANAVLVDPENPAIVYVGTDIGVYVTTSITQCGDVTQNCWGLYGAGLPPVRITALTAVDSSGETWLRAGTKGRGVWQTELASIAIRTSTGSATMLPSPLNFAPQTVGTTSGTESLTVRNTGIVPLTLGSPSVTGNDFVVTSGCPPNLAAGASCTISIVFAPTAIGQRSATLTMAANVDAGTLSADLEGVGTQAATIVLTPLRMDFGSVRIGQSSPVQYLTVANTGGNPAALKPLQISGPFSFSANTCGSSLPPNTACTVGIVFTPVESGAASGSLVAIDDAGTQTALLSGNGQTGPTDTLSAVSLTFGEQAIGTTSAAQQVTVTNTGDSPLTNIKVQVTGDFSATNLCGASLPGHSSCALQVVYTPKAVGAERGQMTLQDSLGAQVVALSGAGVPPATGSGAIATFSPMTLDFGAQGVNSISSPQQLTVINSGTTPLSGITVAASQGFAIAGNACTTVAPGARCTVMVTFAPVATGSEQGTVAVTANESTSPFNVPVSGIGADFQLSVQGATSSTVTGGSSATYQLLLTPVGASAGQISFACAGAPEGSTCATNPATVTMAGNGATATIQVTIQTTATTAAHSRPAPWRGGVAAGAALCCLVLWRRRGWTTALSRSALLVVAGVVCLGMTGCGLSINGGVDGGGGSGGGSQGAYTITVGAAAPGLTRNVTLNLTVE